MDAEKRAKLMERVYGMVDLSTIPIILAKVTAVAEDPESSREELVKVLEHDQTLAAKVIELSNAAFYGHSRQIQTLNEAVALLGFEAVKGLAISSTIFSEISKGAGGKLVIFWRHSFEVARTAMILARMTGEARPERTFLAGLLHDIGRPILYQFFGDDYIATSEVSKNLVSDEEFYYGASHADVGSWFADKCRFPEDLVMAIRLHHIPESHLLDQNFYLPLVYLADYIVSDDGTGPGIDHIHSPEHDKILRILNLNDESLEALKEKIAETQTQAQNYY